MRIEIGDKNKIKNSNIGNNNTINKDDKSKKIVDIIVGILVTVVGGLILYHLTK